MDLLFSIVDQNQAAHEFIQTKQLDPVFRGLGLEDLLVAPIFRFESYSKATIQLLELTPKHHPDRDSLDEATEQLHHVQLRVNFLFLFFLLLRLLDINLFFFSNSRLVL